ncbi:TonB-dependent receptor [Fusobacterium sp.]|uniref:TonB-dependent receptor n=1 Tax=Fusobacterium sp. TaxID=68766 RepID=UPI00396C7A87
MKKYLLLMSMLAVASGVYAENSARLDETVISTTGFETTVKDEVKNINIITKDDIERKNYSSVEEILKDSPFIQTTNEGYGVTFDMRGQGGRATSRVKILVDGIPVNMMNMLYGTQCAFPVNNIPVDQIEKIEIVPGGGAVLYGNGTSGGFINIVTTNKKGTYASVGGSYGSYENKNGDVNVGVQLTEKLSADFNYIGRNTRGYRDTEKTQSDNLIGKVRYDIAENQQIISKIEKYTENYHRTGSITREQLNEDRRQADPNNFRDGKLTKENYLIGYLGKFDNIEVASTGYIENSHDKQLQNVDRSLSTFWTKEKKSGANIKGKYTYSKGDIILGYDFLREKANSYGNGHMGGNYYDVTKDTNSFYALNRYDITNKFQFTAGIRGEFARYDLESIDKKHKVVTGKPSLDSCSYEGALNYLYSDTGNVYIKYENAFTSPNAAEYFDKDYKVKSALGMPPKMTKSMGENSKKGIPAGMGGKPDALEAFYVLNDVKPEKTDTIEIGMKDIFGNVYVSATTYYSQTKDEIIKDSMIAGSIGPVWTYRNEKTERKGVEFYSEQYFNKFTLNQSVSYVDAKIKSGERKNQEVPYVSKWRGTLGGEYRFTDKLTFSFVANFYSKSYNGWTTSVMKMPARDKGYKKGYNTFDVSARYSFDNGLTLITGINNLFNEKYYLSEDKGATAYRSRRVVGSYIPAPERNYYVGFRYDI